MMSARQEALRALAETVAQQGIDVAPGALGTVTQLVKRCLSLPFDAPDDEYRDIAERAWALKRRLASTPRTLN